MKMWEATIPETIVPVEVTKVTDNYIYLFQSGTIKRERYGVRRAYYLDWESARRWLIIEAGVRRELARNQFTDEERILLYLRKMQKPEE